MRKQFGPTLLTDKFVYMWESGEGKKGAEGVWQWWDDEEERK